MAVCNTYRVMLHFLNPKGNHFISQSGSFFGWGLKEYNSLIYNYVNKKEAIEGAYLYARKEDKLYNKYKYSHSDAKYVGFHIEPFKLIYNND
jgi:hypothetical protein